MTININYAHRKEWQLSNHPWTGLHFTSLVHTVYSPIPLIQTSNNRISTLSGLQVTFPIFWGPASDIMIVWVKYLNFSCNLRILLFCDTSVYQQMVTPACVYNFNSCNKCVHFQPMLVRSCITIDPDIGLQTIKIKLVIIVSKRLFGNQNNDFTQKSMHSNLWSRSLSK